MIPAALLVLWLVGVGPLGSLIGQLASVQKNDSASFLPESAESTQVQRQATQFLPANVLPAIVVYEQQAGLSEADLNAIQADVAWMKTLPSLRGEVVGPILSADKNAAQVVVPLDAKSDVAGAVNQIRDRASAHPGLSAHVAGPAGFTTDLTKAFAGIDGTLVLVTGLLVFIILIVVYRSPLLPVLVLTTSLLALSLAGAVTYALASSNVIDLNGQSQGILFILVIGASTDYALLLVARYREELKLHEHRLDAMRKAYRAALPPILASGATVILALLCLLFTDLKSTRGLGPVAAIGIASSLLAALTLLPSVLVLLGRSAFWPVRPKFGEPDAGREGIWDRVSRLVGRRPRVLWVTITVALLVCAAAFLPQLKASGTSQSAVFLHTEDSVVGQDILAKHFSAGIGSPVQILADQGALQAVVTATSGMDGILPSSVAPVTVNGAPGAPAKVVDGQVLIQATLSEAADSPEAVTTVLSLRDTLHAVPGADAKVGGLTASQADTEATSEHDRSIVIPIVLIVILLVLMVLLRAIVAPLLLVATVVLSYTATLGIAALVFNHVFHFPGADPSVPLFAFVFLVALGVDYNIFLMSRVREESQLSGTYEGTLRGLRATGGVITSAGIVLAATFAALAVIPLLFLAQIAFLVAFGVLLDTLLVRALLVPAAVIDLDHRTWWPSRL
ncbi:MAG: MMPL family transporter, partial [Candidatus Nanopelagicales bacterium]